MAVTDQQKLDFLLKKIGYTKTKTGSVVGTGAISGTPKQPFAEAIPSPLVVPNSSLWNEAASIPATAPGSDTVQVKVYSTTSALRMTADATSSGQRAYIAYTTYNDTSSARLTNWIDTQFGASYLIKVYKGDPNSGGVALSAAGSGSNDGWFFDYSAGVLNFNDTSVPSGVTDTNIYIVGYRYTGQTGAPTSGISTFSNLDLTVERNLDVGKQGGISTFRHNVQLLDNDKLQFGDSQDLEIYHDSNHSYIDDTGTGNLKIRSGTIEVSNLAGSKTSAVFNSGSSQDLYFNNTKRFETTNTGIHVTGDGVFSGNVSIGGTLTYEDVVNVDSVGIVTAQAGIRVTGGVIEALAGENKIPSLYAAMGNLPSAGSYHGMFAHVHATGRGYFAHAGNWYELVNKEVNGVVGTGTERYNIGPVDLTTLDVSGISTFAGNVDINADIDVDGHTNLDNVSIAGVTTMSGNLSISNATPILYFIDTGANPDYHIKNNNGYFDIVDGTNAATRLSISNTGELTVFGNSNFNAGIDVTGDANVSGDLDVDGHTDLDNVSIAGVTTTAGNVDINADLDVDGHTNLDNVSIAGVTSVASLTSGRVVTAGTGGKLQDSNNLTFDGSNLFVSGINITGGGATSILGADIVTRNLKATGLSTFVGQSEFDGNAKFDSTITAGGSTGTNGQYLKTTGTGVEWASFPTMRTSQTFTASSGQTTFSFSYTVGFLDVFVNGVKLASSEFTATNGTSVVLAVGSFVGDIVELISYYTVSGGGGGGGGISNVVEDTTPQLGGNLDLFNKSITGTGNVNITGIITATNFVGDGSGLTGITASGSGVIVKDSGSTVGTAGTINFGDNLSVSPASAGIVTITASAGTSSTAEVRANTLVVTGVSTLTNIDVDDFIDVGSNIQLGSVGVITALTFKGNGDFVELDVDGHTNLDNVSIAGVSTFAGTVNTDAISASGALSVSDIRSNSLNLKNAAGSATYAIFTNGGSALLKHNNTDRLETSASGVTVTGTVAATSYTGDGSQLTNVGVQTSQFNVNKLDVSGISTFKGNIDVNADLDVDGHTNLDNVSVAGVVTATTFVGALTGNVTGNTSGSSGSCTGNAATATLATDATSFTVSANNSTNETVYPVFVDGATGSQGAETDTGLTYNPSTGALSSLKFIGDGSGLTGVTGSGTGIAIKNSGSTVGTAGTINFGDNLSVSAISGGSVTVTATAGVSTNQFNVNKLDVSGISTFSGNIDVNADLDVDGHTNLDNVSIAGVTTFASDLVIPQDIIHAGDADTKVSFAANDSLSIITGGNTKFNASTNGLTAYDKFIPNADNSHLLGQGSGPQRRWSEVHAVTYYGDGSNLTGVAANIGITTSLSGSFTASAGTAATINTLTGYSANDLVVEYTIYIKNGSDFQTQKLLAMRDGTTIHSTQFAVMFSSSLLVQCDATISSGNILLRATPETGVSGSTTYKIKREVM